MKLKKTFNCLIAVVLVLVAAVVAIMYFGRSVVSEMNVHTASAVAGGQGEAAMSQSRSYAVSCEEAYPTQRKFGAVERYADKFSDSAVPAARPAPFMSERQPETPGYERYAEFKEKLDTFIREWT